MRAMKHHMLLAVTLVALGTAAVVTSSLTIHAQQSGQAGAAPAAARTPAAPRVRPPLFFREEWKQQTPPEDPDRRVTQEFVRNPDLELKLYGPAGKDLVITGRDNDPQNPTHIWSGLCAATCAMTLRHKTSFVDLTGQAKARWVTKVSGFQQIHPVVKLADGTFLAGDWADGSRTDWRETEFYFADVRWVKLDPERVVTVGAMLDKVDLSKVDEFGWTSLMPSNGHGQGSWSDVGLIEVYGKPVAR
jgi:hypothetical protein